MSVRKWAQTAVLPSIDQNQQLMFLDTTQSNPADRIKRATMATLDTKILSTIQKTNLGVGFSIAGGTTSKTLTVLENCTLDQNLQTTASPSFSSIISNVFSSTSSGVNTVIFNANPLKLNSQNTGTGTTSWIAASIGGQAGVGNRVVIGLLNGHATVGAHNDALNAWAPIYISTFAAGNVGINLANSIGQTANAALHSGGTTILGIGSSAIADASIYTSQFNPWIDETNDIINFKVKKSGGSIITIPLQHRLRSRIIIADDTNTADDDIVFIDTTLNSVKLTVDVSILRKPLTIVNYVGVGACQFQAASGQSINNITLPIDLNGQWTTSSIMKVSSTNGFIYAFSTN